MIHEPPTNHQPEEEFPAWCRIVDLELEHPGFHDALRARLEAKRAELIAREQEPTS